MRGVERNSASRHCRSERNSGIEGKGTKVVERMRTNAAYRRANWGREAQSLRPTSKGNGRGYGRGEEVSTIVNGDAVTTYQGQETRCWRLGKRGVEGPAGYLCAGCG